MVAGTIDEENIQPFVIFLADLVAYDLLQEEIEAIRLGARECDINLETWYDYELQGKRMLKCWFAGDGGDDSGMIWFRVEAEGDDAIRITTAAAIFDEYEIRGGRSGRPHTRLR